MGLIELRVPAAGGKRTARVVWLPTVALEGRCGIGWLDANGRDIERGDGFIQAGILFASERGERVNYRADEAFDNYPPDTLTDWYRVDTGEDAYVDAAGQLVIEEGVGA